MIATQEKTEHKRKLREMSWTGKSTREWVMLIFVVVQTPVLFIHAVEARDIWISLAQMAQCVIALLLYGLLVLGEKHDRLTLTGVLCALTTAMALVAFYRCSYLEYRDVIYPYGIFGALVALLFLPQRMADGLAIFYLACAMLLYGLLWPTHPAHVTGTILFFFSHLCITAGVFLSMRATVRNARRKEEEKDAALRHLNTAIHDHGQTKERLEMMTNAVPGGVYRARADNRLTLQYINQGFAELVGQTREILYVERYGLLDLVHPEERDSVAKEIAEQVALHADRSFDIECRLQLGSGHVLWVNNRGICSVETPTEPMVFSGLIMNITDTYLAQKHLMEAQRELIEANNAKSQFLAHMSHEIRTPIHAVMGLADLLLLSNKLFDEQKAQALGIKQASQTLLSLVNDILDFSKISAGQMRVVPAPYRLGALLDDLCAQTGLRMRGKPLRFCIFVQPDLPRGLIGDELRIKQVLLNLLTNAVKFTPEGTVTLRITGKPKGRKWLLRYEVLDTGLGIRKRDMVHLFEGFMQLDPMRNRAQEGSGLGLTISQGLVRLMGGEMTVRSEYGKGSQFEFTLRQEADDAVSFALVEDAPRKKLLLCSADEAWCAHLLDCADALGVPVSCASAYDATAQCTHMLIDARDVSAPMWMAYPMPALGNRGVVYHGDSVEADAQDTHLLATALHAGTLADFLNNRSRSGEHATQIAQLARNVFDTRDTAVLIVDDNPANLLVGSALLKLFGLTVDEATSGTQALEMMRTTIYDLVFMDHMMPGMDGEEAVRRMREQPELADVPVAILTANAASDVQPLFAPLGVQALLTKPLALDKLSAALLKLLPPEKIIQDSQREHDRGEPERYARDCLASVEGLDYQEGLAHCAQDESLFLMLLFGMARDCAEKAVLLRDAIEQNDQFAITLCTHSLKSSLASIGQNTLSARASALETHAHNTAWERVAAGMPDFLADLDAFCTALTQALSRLPRETQLEFSLTNADIS